jgi:hypothetical protein
MCDDTAYSTSVIVVGVLSDIQDGLKPVYVQKGTADLQLTLLLCG